ncbi:hypothetical protein P7K49_032965 [Saguinus oedipus]|uniref:Uncharacterized protein n=1 Tax=Saguinus oedipus TaxID=9490 RepID=A0ABQ9TQJ7_SAGOE|nr:hypothetical protein P7K49_032965 [Saguinus oedipus]
MNGGGASAGPTLPSLGRWGCPCLKETGGGETGGAGAGEAAAAMSVRRAVRRAFSLLPGTP